MSGAAAGVADSFPFDDGDPNSITDDRWRGSGTNGDPTVSQELRIFAICDR